MWWTTGIAYDTTKIKETLTSSKALWDPNATRTTSRCMDDYQETMGMALKQLGYSVNTTDTTQLDAAHRPAQAAEATAADVHQRHDQHDGRRRRLDRA